MRLKKGRTAALSLFNLQLLVTRSTSHVWDPNHASTGSKTDEPAHRSNKSHNYNPPTSDGGILVENEPLVKPPLSFLKFLNPLV